MDKFNFKNYIEQASNFKEVILELFDIPIIKKTGKIVQLDYNKNPILIMLDDSTKLYLTYDEFKRIKFKPKIGDKISVQMQRHIKNNSNIPSQIISINLV